MVCLAISIIHVGGLYNGECEGDMTLLENRCSIAASVASDEFLKEYKHRFSTIVEYTANIVFIMSPAILYI